MEVLCEAVCTLHGTATKVRNLVLLVLTQGCEWERLRLDSLVYTLQTDANFPNI